jgi:hypothetical protein
VAERMVLLVCVMTHPPFTGSQADFRRMPEAMCQNYFTHHDLGDIPWNRRVQ